MQSWYNYIDNLINGENIINEKMPEIIEAFVDYYGEEMREKITDKFNNVTILQTITPKQIEKICEDIPTEFEKQTREKIKDILNLNSTSEIDNYISNGLTEEEKTKIMPLYKDMIFLRSHANKYIQALTMPIEKINEINLENSLNSFKGLLNIEKEQYQTYFNTLICREKEMFPPHLQDYIDKIEYLNKQVDENNIDVDEFYNKLNELEQNDKRLEEIKQMIGDFDGNDGLIDSFSSEANEILKGENTPKWQKKQILHNRTEYLKLFEKSMGNIDMDDMGKILPTSDEADKFLLYKGEYNYAATKSIYLKMSLHQKNLEIIENNFPDSEEEYVDIIRDKNSLGCCIPELTKKDDKYFDHGLIFLNKGEKIENLDETLIHELNHWLEINIDIPFSEDDCIYNATSGWSMMSGQVIGVDIDEEDEYEYQEEEDPYELFDENINDQIAREITKKLHDKDTYIFSHKDHMDLENPIYYQNYDFLTRNFFEQYKDEIIKSRQAGSFKYLDYILNGQVTLLNDLINKCEETLGHDIAQISKDMENNKINDNVLNALRFKEISEMLLNQMKENQNIDNKSVEKHR